MPSGKPKKSPQAIAKGLAQKLRTGDYIGTRKMKKRPFGASFLLTVNAPKELTNLLTSDVDSNVDSSAGLRAITGVFPLVQSRH